jgi:hypothetical protein
MSDKVYNFFNCCEHPRIIKNKYTGEPVYVKCGVCPHCLISRSDAKRNLCDYEKSNRKYCYFVTLTYNSQLTLSEETDDLRHLISMALLKLDSFNTASETYHIVHIDSISELRGVNN